MAGRAGDGDAVIERGKGREVVGGGLGGGIAGLEFAEVGVEGEVFEAFFALVVGVVWL